MVSQLVKDTLKQENLLDILKIDDENDLISGVQIRIRMETENRGKAEIYIFGHAYSATAFINGPGSCYLEDFSEFNGTLSIGDIFDEVNEMSPSLNEILNVFHVKFQLIPKSVYQ